MISNTLPALFCCQNAGIFFLFAEGQTDSNLLKIFMSLASKRVTLVLELLIIQFTLFCVPQRPKHSLS